MCVVILQSGSLYIHVNVDREGRCVYGDSTEWLSVCVDVDREDRCVW